jgi:hypothetical protein
MTREAALASRTSISALSVFFIHNIYARRLNASVGTRQLVSNPIGYNVDHLKRLLGYAKAQSLTTFGFLHRGNYFA